MSPRLKKKDNGALFTNDEPQTVAGDAGDETPAQPRFLPMTREEMQARGWDELDVIVVTGDGYVDHPYFTATILARCLEREGFRVGIIAQPDWKKKEDFLSLGQPKLFCIVTAGNIDSMLNRLTVHRKLRTRDMLFPGGVVEGRPKRASIVYSNRAREAFPGVPIIVTGMEADLRRIAYFDYWENSLRRSVLLDSRADLLVCGTGELAILEIARLMSKGKKIDAAQKLPGVAYVTDKKPAATKHVFLPSFEEVRMSKKLFNQAFKQARENCDHAKGKPIVQPTHDEFFVVVNPPSRPLTTEEMDAIFGLPYIRMAHPKHDAQGGVPIVESIRFNMITHRGCYADCNFCSLAVHQGRIIQNRSKESLVAEAKSLAAMPDFKGVITDVGGPSANMYGTGCGREEGMCGERDCLLPAQCPNLKADTQPMIEMLGELRAVPGVEQAAVTSSVRHDMLLNEPENKLLNCLCKDHVRGRLRVAPEHCCDNVLEVMNRPPFKVYEDFCQAFVKINLELNKEQYLTAHWMSGHPGCELKDMVKLAQYFRQYGIFPEHVQDYYPAPLTVSACIYHTGYHPITGAQYATAGTDREKLLQRALLHFQDPKNDRMVREALVAANSEHLIGRGPDCLIMPMSRIFSDSPRSDRVDGSMSGRSPGFRPDDRDRQFRRPPRPPMRETPGDASAPPAPPQSARPMTSPGWGRPSNHYKPNLPPNLLKPEQPQQDPGQPPRPPAPPRDRGSFGRPRDARDSRDARDAGGFRRGARDSFSQRPASGRRDFSRYAQSRGDSPVPRKPELEDIESAPEFYEEPGQLSQPRQEPPPPENASRTDYDHSDADSKFNREFDQDNLRPLSYRDHPDANGKTRRDRNDRPRRR